MQIVGELIAVVLDKKVVALAYVFGRYREGYGFAAVGGIEFIRAIPNKAVRKVLYRVDFVETVT